MSAKSLGKQPVGYSSRRGPPGSYENSPNGSDDGTETSTSDDGKLPSIAYAGYGGYPAYGRPTSVRSAVTVPGKPKTYFSHAGKVTVDPNAPPPAPKEVQKTKLANETTATPVEVPVKEEKKKSRLGLRFGKK